jgi:putative sterol carrier protein
MSEPTVAEYFTTTVPAAFRAAMVESSAPAADLTVNYTVTGEQGGVYGLQIQGNAIEVVPGGITPNDMHVTLTHESWHDALAHGVSEQFIDYLQRGKAEVVKGLQGAVQMELTHSDGSTSESHVVFGGSAEPELTIRMTAEDYAAMMRGDLNGNMAFMTGRLKFEGSLPLLMKLGALGG